MWKQWTVLINAENRFYDCSKWIWIYSKHDVQRANFINVEIDFINVEKQIWLLRDFINVENTISGGVLWENSEQFFKLWTENNLCKKESEQFFK